MIVKATKEQVVEMAKLAIMASKPMGMGFLHYNPDLKHSEIALSTENGGVYVDYYQGRMVKFCAREVPGGYEVDDTIGYDYQSWVRLYASYEVLFNAVNTGKEDVSVGQK